MGRNDKKPGTLLERFALGSIHLLFLTIFYVETVPKWDRSVIAFPSFVSLFHLSIDKRAKYWSDPISERFPHRKWLKIVGGSIPKRIVPVAYQVFHRSVPPQDRPQNWADPVRSCVNEPPYMVHFWAELQWDRSLIRYVET